MRKFDDQMQLGFPIILRLRARAPALDLRLHGLINSHWWVIGVQLEHSGRLHCVGSTAVS